MQGVPKKRTFRIIILQADTSERSDSRRLESDLSEVPACRMMIMKLRLFGASCIHLCIAQHFVRLVCWLLYGHSLSVTRASPLLKGSYAVVNPPIKYITQEHQSDDDDDGHYTRGDDDDGQGQACR